MASVDESESGRKRDLIHLTGPLTQEAILRQLHQNFIEGRCYVSYSTLYIIYIYIYSLNKDYLVRYC